MQCSAELEEIFANRESLYRFLGRVYCAEVDQSFLNEMAKMAFPQECVDVDLQDGYRTLASYFQTPCVDPVTDLAVDYARTFLGAGLSDHAFAAFPYESVYTSPDRLIMQEARDQVVALYRSKGLERTDAFDGPEDHIGLELEFMALLCRESLDAAGARNWSMVFASLEDQRNFLASHLMNWVPGFYADVIHSAETDFYRAIAKITSGYLRLDQEAIQNIMQSVSEENSTTE